MGIRFKKEIFKHLFFNISALFIALFIYETYLTYYELKKDQFLSTLEVTGSTNESYVAHDENLGYKPNDGVYNALKKYNQETIYNVEYTIKNNLRHTPNSNEDSQDCALFFGCSVTFGEGLNDTSTLPYYFNQNNNKKYKILNYGFHGYGPHQMLEHIKHRVKFDVSDGQGEKIAVYNFQLFHIGRAAGYSPWDQYGPKFEIINGELKRVGTFSIRPSGIINKSITKIFSVSRIYQKFFTKINHETTDYDILRTIEIIKESNRLLQEENIKLYVFIYDLDEYVKNSIANQTTYNKFINELKQSNIAILYLNEIISDYFDNYTIHRLDKHPNEKFNKKIAKYLSSKLQSTSKSTQAPQEH